jgi:BirA family transcriptional regulator, biotin operon repressor / biotin---[acetyl-CoA-carboxylase] ligase
MLKNVVYVISRVLSICVVTITLCSPYCYAEDKEVDISAPATTSTVVKLDSGEELSLVRHAFDFVGSTQTWSKEHTDIIPKNGWMVVTAKRQFSGVGTNGRVWHSPEGNIYVTFSKRLSEITPLTVEQKLRIKQVASLAVVQTLETLGIKSQIKWSNDVLLNRKKISGVLDEIIDDVLIIGVGLNINMSQEEADRVNVVCVGDPNKIPATSLLIEQGQPFDIEAIFQELQRNFYTNLDLLFNNKFDDFVKKVESRLTCKIGNEVTVQPAQLSGHPLEQEIKGRFIGLNKYGSAIIEIIRKDIVEVNDGRMVLDINSTIAQSKEIDAKGEQH